MGRSGFIYSRCFGSGGRRFRCCVQGRQLCGFSVWFVQCPQWTLVRWLPHLSLIEMAKGLASIFAGTGSPQEEFKKRQLGLDKALERWSKMILRSGCFRRLEFPVLLQISIHSGSCLEWCGVIWVIHCSSSLQKPAHWSWKTDLSPVSVSLRFNSQEAVFLLFFFF